MSSSGRRDMPAAVAAAAVLFTALLCDAADPALSGLSLSQLRERAIAHERAGSKMKAAEVYEHLIQRDPAKRMVLAHRLSTLYAELGLKGKAALEASGTGRSTVENDPQLRQLNAELREVRGGLRNL